MNAATRKARLAAVASPSAPTKWDPEVILVAQAAACVSFLSFLYYLRQGDLLLYGDVLGHINIARRVFDSQTPGLLQLGTVWLPLPHLLMIPFLLSTWLWQTGIGGSIPSLFSFILAVIGVFRLVRETLSVSQPPDLMARRTAWFAAIVFAANPNLIYLQTTAMTETLYLALSIWAIVHFAEFIRHKKSQPQAARVSLLKCEFCLFGACLTRYDGWMLAAAMCAVALILAIRSWMNRQLAMKLILLASAAPILWIIYNDLVYRNPLEFANGPYSAKALAQKDAETGTAPYPGANNLPTAATFFLKSAQLNLAVGNWGRLWIAFGLAGLVIALMQRRLWTLLFLLIPVPFYTLSIAYSGVPIYLPVWWPHGYYNVRYGIELLPAVAVFASIAVSRRPAMLANRRAGAAYWFLIVLLIALSYGAIWRARSICLQEAFLNSRTRTALETAMATNLKKLPADSSLLMYLGDHVGALQRAGIPLRRAISENNSRPWMKPSDPQSLWELALGHPSLYADYVIAVQGDPVDVKVNHAELTPLIVIHTEGQPAATLYATIRGNLQR